MEIFQGEQKNQRTQQAPPFLAPITKFVVCLRKGLRKGYILLSLGFSGFAPIPTRLMHFRTEFKAGRKRADANGPLRWGPTEEARCQ